MPACSVQPGARSGRATRGSLPFALQPGSIGWPRQMARRRRKHTAATPLCLIVAFARLLHVFDAGLTVGTLNRLQMERHVFRRLTGQHAENPQPQLLAGRTAQSPLTPYGSDGMFAGPMLPKQRLQTPPQLGRLPQSGFDGDQSFGGQLLVQIAQQFFVADAHRIHPPSGCGLPCSQDSTATRNARTRLPARGYRSAATVCRS